VIVLAGVQRVEVGNAIDATTAGGNNLLHCR
jgi:hypothetical protein